MLHNSLQRGARCASLLVLSLFTLSLGWSQQPQTKLSSEERIKRDLFYLASDECEGRGPGTLGIDRAAVYIAGQLKDAGVKPGGVSKTWFQPFTIGKNLPCKNVIGVVEGSGPLADETVVIGAHYDHLGYGGFGSRNPKEKAIHPGADDNASGTVTVMELARRFAAMKDREGRRLVFILFSAEERGLLGSRYYCAKEPLFPLDKTVAMINMDMIGRMRGDKDNKGGRFEASGLGSGKGFEALMDKINEKHGFNLKKDQGGLGSSDGQSFYAVKVPTLDFGTGGHKEYHTPKDTAETINIPGMKRATDFIEDVVAHLASDPARIEYTVIMPKKKPVPKPDDK